MYKVTKHLLKGLGTIALAGIIYSSPYTSVAQSSRELISFYPDSTYSDVHGQNQSSRDESGQGEMNRGDCALQFRISSNFTLKDFSGTLISFQRTLSNRNAIRWGLSLAGGFHKRKGDPEGHRTNTRRLTITVSMNYLWYSHIHHKIRLYYGGGPMVSFGYYHSKNTQISDPGIAKKTISSVSGKVGVTGVAGVEWFVRPNISLIAEYVPELTTSYGNTIRRFSSNDSGGKFKTNLRTQKSTTNIHLGSAPVRFGVSVYF